METIQPINPQNVADIKEGQRLELHFKMGSSSRQRKYYTVQAIDRDDQGLPTTFVLERETDGIIDVMNTLEMFNMLRLVREIY